MSAIVATSLRQPVAQNAALGDAASPMVCVPDATPANPRAGCRLIETLAGVFKAVHTNAASLVTYLSKRIAAVFTIIYSPASLFFRRAGEPENAASGRLGEVQEDGGNTRRVGMHDLPRLPIERIFHSLAASDRIALSMTSRAFRQPFRSS